MSKIQIVCNKAGEDNLCKTCLHARPHDDNFCTEEDECIAELTVKCVPVAAIDGKEGERCTK